MKTIYYLLRIEKYGNFNLIKYFFFILVFLHFIEVSGYSQKNTVNNQTIKTEDKDKSRTDRKRDTTIIDTEKKLYLFIETPGGLIIDRIDLATGVKKRILDLGNDKVSKKDSIRFRGHWSGIKVGINGFMSPGYKFASPAGYDYFNLNVWRSWAVNINFAQFSIPLIKNNLGLVTGLGLEVNNYFFKNDNNIQLNQTTGAIEEWHTEEEYKVKKSKFTTTHLTLPLLLEYQTRGAGKKLFYVSGGIISGWNILSARKIKYELDGHDQKLLLRGGDLNINKFDSGATFQIGSRDKGGISSGLFATYYFTPLFEKDKGPELYPFEAGLRIDF